MNINDTTPKIGKNAIENLTISMYDDPRIIYREYIQNSCDQIDKAMSSNSFPNEELAIDIKINPKKRYISIYDNANGIPSAEVKTRLGDIADSQKTRGEERGFRGIGRLGGLAYCRELRFTTSYIGEDHQTTMIWDAKKLRDLLADRDVHDSAEDVLVKVIRYETSPYDSQKHFFQVELIDVNKENDSLLDTEDIKAYVSEVAPVEYVNTFYYRTEIDRFLNEHKDELPNLSRYTIFVNDEEMFRNYPTRIYKVDKNNKKTSVDEIKKIHTDIIRNSQGDVIAWIWFGISTFNGQINAKGNPMRGIRIRQDNIEIGNEKTISHFFKEDRGYGYYMGEIHTNSKLLTPNARRDYFVETPALREFENSIQTYIDTHLNQLYQQANVFNKRFDEIQNYNAKKEEYEKAQIKGFKSPQIRDRMKDELEKAEAKAKKAENTIANMKKKAEEQDDTSPFREMIQAIVNSQKAKKERDAKKKNEPKVKSAKNSFNNKKKTNDSENKYKKNKDKLIVDDLPFGRKEKKIISRIYDVISANTAPDISDALIAKIQEELKKPHVS